MLPVLIYAIPSIIIFFLHFIIAQNCTYKCSTYVQRGKQTVFYGAQTELAKEIGENVGYQEYLIKVKTVDKEQVVKIAKAESMAKALASADLKILANSGDVQSGLNKFTDILSSKGGSQINGLLETLKHTDESKAILRLLSKLNPLSDTDKK